jgi:hypothetical protein
LPNVNAILLSADSLTRWLVGLTHLSTTRPQTILKFRPPSSLDYRPPARSFICCYSIPLLCALNRNIRFVFLVRKISRQITSPTHNNDIQANKFTTFYYYSQLGPNHLDLVAATASDCNRTKTKTRLQLTIIHHCFGDPR